MQNAGCSLMREEQRGRITLFLPAGHLSSCSPGYHWPLRLQVNSAILGSAFHPSEPPSTSLKCSTLHLILLKFMRFLSGHLSGLSSPNRSHLLCQSHHLLRVHSIPLSVSLILKSTSPRRSPEDQQTPPGHRTIDHISPTVSANS